MKRVFSALTELSLRFRVLTLGLVAAILVAGAVAYTQLKQELIPAVEFPQTIILAQVSGMTSEQVSNVVTHRLETALDEQVEAVANIESQTTGAFGTVITARNDFGQNQERLRDEIQAALDSVWMPLRRIQVTDAATALGEMTPNVLIYLAERDSNFLFQLSPEVWAALPNETVQTVLGYMAAKTQSSAGQETALRRLVDQEIVPALANIPIVANINVYGGQVLPEDGAPTAADLPEATNPPQSEGQSILLQLSPEVWNVVSGKVEGLGARDASAVTAMSAVAFEIPTEAPALPPSLQMDRFKDARDLLEMRTLTRNVGAVFNTFLDTGEIVGALGQTDDLTVDVVNQMLAIDPTLAEYFEAEHLVAMSDDVFAALPDSYIAGLDGFTRDELAAKALARAITGEDAAPSPVDLPQPWRIQPPQLISFSFDDLPLASFSISGDGLVEASAPDVTAAPIASSETETETQTDPVAVQNLPEGPVLPAIFGLFADTLGIQLDTADDLVNIQLPESLAEQFGSTNVSAANLFNLLAQVFSNPDALAQLSGGGEDGAAPQFDVASALPALIECGVNPLGLASGNINFAQIIIGCLNADVISYLVANDPTFAPTLSAEVYEYFSNDVLALPNLAPPLDDAWSALAGQPQFRGDSELGTAADLVSIDGGSASSVLNAINANVPERFAGYEVRLFSSLTPATIRYFTLNEPDFFSKLDPAVLEKLSPAALALVPDEVLAGLDPALAEKLTAIAAGEQPSAADELAALYATDAIPEDPNAPALNPDWVTIASFLSIELDTADDFFRFPEAIGGPTVFINGIFNSPQGAAFAPGLLGGLSLDAINYIQGREANFLNDLRAEALQLLSEDVLAGLPAEVQERAVSGGTPFVPTDRVTRTNGSASLSVVVYKERDANTVEAFHTVEEVLAEIDGRDEAITITTGFEQSSFIEESISGVTREGLLGAIFAVVVILIFLSTGGNWRRAGRSITGAVLVAIFLGLLALLVLQAAPAYNNDLGQAFDSVDITWRILLLGGVGIGLIVMFAPTELPYPAWRSTLVTAVSIPLSVMMALAFMRWIPPAVNSWLAPAAESSPLLTFFLRLFPESITLNIMTLSGLTVAIGRVVDDSIVVLENIFRQVQEGGDRRQAIITGTRDVSVAIFAATVITVVVFLPLGLTGGIIGEFFLPFGLAVTYSLLASFIVAITVVPVLAYLLLDPREMGDEHKQTWIERTYLPVLNWALSSGRNRVAVLVIAGLSLVVGGALFATRPQAFLPSFGEPQISVDVSMPSGTNMIETNLLTEEFESALRAQIPEEELGTVQVTIGGGTGFQALLTGNTSISENVAQITIGLEDPNQLDRLTGEVRELAEPLFGPENVKVSGASLSEQGFGGFALVLSGPRPDLEAINERIVETLETVPGLANVTSNIGGLAGESGPTTLIRIDRESAVRYTGELETENTLGVTSQAKAAIQAMPDLPSTVKVSEGFETQLQTQGFANLFVAMGIAIAIVVVILMVTFGSLVHWLDIILSIVVAPVGAAVLLTLTDRVLGISALIGLLMLIGIVVTNAVVLIDRVQSNRRERGMDVRDALMEAGERRLRPILMTALATVGALSPLAFGLSKGAIIASELGTVVIGGLVSSTILTLLVVPVAYILLSPLHKRIAGLFGRK
jgi:multidrug efflux pump subunit AcrB